MKIYRMIPDYDRCHDFDAGVFPGRDDLGNAMLRGDPLLEKWKSLHVSRRPTKGKKTDFVMTSWTYAKFGVNARAAEVLRPYVEASCELLPFEYRKDRYWLVYVREMADCLDLRRTIFNGLDKSARNVLVAAFTPKRLPNHPLFRLPGGDQYYVTEQLKDVIEKAKLTGARFQFMWSDDGSEPDEPATEPKTKPRQKRTRRPARPTTKREFLLQRLWQEVILPRGDGDSLQEKLTLSRLVGWDGYNSARAARRLLKSGAAKEDILDLMRSLAYEVVFDVLVAIEEECLDESPALDSLHEDLLVAEPI